MRKEEEYLRGKDAKGTSETAAEILLRSDSIKTILTFSLSGIFHTREVRRAGEAVGIPSMYLLFPLLHTLTLLASH